METNQIGGMKNVELSDEAYEMLQRLAAAKNLAPAELVADLLGANRSVCGDRLFFHLIGGETSKLPEPADRYLALLAWVARNHATDFTDFISHQASARRYLKLSPAAINAIHQQHPTRQIDGTQYWAVMNIDPATKSRFVRRLLEFIGCHDETVAEAIRVLELPPVEPHRSLRLLSVA
jgi:negative modulator of initiation of replication